MARTTNLRRGQRRDQPRPILRRQTEKTEERGGKREASLTHKYDK